MDVKRIALVVVIVATVVFGFFGVKSAKAVVVATSVVDSITCDNSMWQQCWAFDYHHRLVTIETAGSGVYKVTFVDGGYFVTNLAKSPGGDGTSFVGAGVTGGISGGITYLVTGVLKSSVPATVTADYRSGPPGSLKYLLPFFNSISSYSVLAWGWVYASCGNGTWTDNDATETAWQTQKPNSLMGDIVGAPSSCQNPPKAQYQPESCNANSVVLAPYVGHRVRVYLVQASGRQELQFEGSNFVEAGKVNGQGSGKVSVVFYPNSDSWREFEGETLLITVQGYRDGWYWFPKDSEGHLFCDWKPAPNANAK
ncbi:MAG TPA: hypothetical protein VLH19_00725 [Patescibacteria group bacterium]|nr:hypothetical protein [Patescibacteria group bacterium]